MIEKISVTNFKSHAHTEIELGHLTAIVGPNGSGKSSLLLAIQVLKQLAEQIKQGDWNAAPFIKYMRRGSDSMGISVEGALPKWKIAVSTNGSGLRYNFEFANKAWEHKVLYEHDDDEDGIMSWPVDGNPLPEFGQIAYFRAITHNVSLPSHTLDIPPQINQDGSGLASVIAYLMTYLPEKQRLIEEDLKGIVPLVKRVRVHPARITIKEKRTISANGNSIAYDEDRLVVGHELFFDTTSGDGLPASMMSDGTLITLAILSALHTSEANLILFDDIEQALHPLAQRKLMGVLKHFAEQHNNCQIILTSHSPYIVDELDAKDVWVMAADEVGISHCKRLSDHPDATRLLQVLTTGELEGAVGEDWVLPNKALAEEVNA